MLFISDLSSRVDATIKLHMYLHQLTDAERGIYLLGNKAAALNMSKYNAEWIYSTDICVFY